MNIYSFVLFLHIVGALGFFVTLGLEWSGLRQIRNITTSEQIRAWMSTSNGTRRLGMASMFTIVIAGLYLTVSAWGGVAWIIVTLGAMVLMIVLINTLTRPRAMAIGRALSAEKETVLPTLQSLANDPRLWISIRIRLAVALGIVFLMTAKPGLGGSLLTMSVAVVIGLASALSVPHRDEVQKAGEPR